jgi:hypothetical protein
MRELRRARQDFGEDSAMTDESERFTGRWLPADLVHLRGTDGYHKRLKWSADWELLNRGSVLPYTVVLHVAHGTRFTTVGGPTGEGLRHGLRPNS